nr:MAG TPA: hypothetical protein [Caudoviricetes sp.]
MGVRYRSSLKDILSVLYDIMPKMSNVSGILLLRYRNGKEHK